MFRFNEMKEKKIKFFFGQILYYGQLLSNNCDVMLEYVTHSTQQLAYMSRSVVWKAIWKKNIFFLYERPNFTALVAFDFVNIAPRPISVSLSGPLSLDIYR